MLAPKPFGHEICKSEKMNEFSFLHPLRISIVVYNFDDDKIRKKFALLLKLKFKTQFFFINYLF